jgi:hypothetical protein
MTDISTKDAGVVFLGVGERVAYVRDGNTNLFKWNVLGLKSIVLSNIFPFGFQNFYIGIAIYSPQLADDLNFRLLDSNDEQLAFFSLKTVAASLGEDDVLDRKKSPIIRAPEQSWTTVFVNMDAQVLIKKPDICKIVFDTKDGPVIIGQLIFALIDPPPLTQERIAAIKSIPDAARHVRMEFVCKFCHSKCRVYASIEKSEKLEIDGWMWYENIPEKFLCECKKTDMDLSIIRRNFHGLLGQKLRSKNDAVDFSPMYEHTVLTTIRSDFFKLLKTAKKEEELQKFIEDNPIILHQFPAENLFVKPAILASYKADFAVVTPQRELLLIELEKPNTKILKKDGGIGAELSHAFDQVSDWLHKVDEHRLTVLEELKIDKSSVSTVKGIVIAGRDDGYDQEALRKLKGRYTERIRFFTYDDLGFALDALIRRMDNL